MTATVLVAGERSAALVAIERCLSGFDVEVVGAGSGSEALEELCDRDVAVLLLGQGLSDTAPLALARVVRGDHDHRQLPMVLVTTDEDWERTEYLAYEVGVFDYLTKPFRRALLRSKVRIFLELHRARAREHDQARKLEQSNRDFRDFAHSAAHDLRAPLRKVAGLLEMLDEVDAEDRDASTELRTAIQASVAHMQTLIRDMLDFARVDSAPLRKRPVDLERCLSDVLDDLSPLVQRARAEVHVGPLPVVSGSESELRRLFQNLVSNAIKYRRDDVDPRVEVTARTRQGFAHLTVEDNGTGFDPKWEEAVFRPFRRLVSPSAQSGSGIGLATARRIVERHGGRISASSVVGRGSTFRVDLPLNAAELSDFRSRGVEDGAPQPPVGIGALGSAITRR